MDIQTFEQEVLKIERLLYRVSWSMLSNQEDCADAVQEALTRAWQKRDSLRSLKAFRSWLIQILSNVCKDMLRKRQKQRWVPLEGEALEALADDTSGFSMLETLQLLSPEHRTTVILYYLEGYRVRDIAEMMGTPAGTVKTRLMKARIYLRQAVQTNPDLHGGIHYEKI
ncbi:MAG: RNA polymerase sigma factor [Candidatus Limiplasma sp.]|nr:RNA polymerase sigma factor [Candidatus Limiplasma sp.]